MPASLACYTLGLGSIRSAIEGDRLLHDIYAYSYDDIWLVSLSLQSENCFI